MDDAEAAAQRRGEEAGAGRRADQRERLQRHLDRARAGALADHQIELVVLERRVEDLLDRRRHAVDLVDEQHLARLEAGQDGGEVAGLLEHRPGGAAHRHAQLVADDVRQRRLAEAGRAVEQHVIEGLAALARRLDRDQQVLADAILPDVLVHRARAQPGVVLALLVGGGAPDQPRRRLVRTGHRDSCRSARRRRSSKLVSAGASLITASTALSTAAGG